MVWNTPQSSMYQVERYFDKCDADDLEETCSEKRADNAGEHYSGCSETRAEPRTDMRRPCSRKPSSKGIFDDGDMMLVFGVLLILMREKADQKLLFALLLAMLM